MKTNAQIFKEKEETRKMIRRLKKEENDVLIFVKSGDGIECLTRGIEEIEAFYILKQFLVISHAKIIESLKIPDLEFPIE